MPKFIVISGKKQSGKTTSATYIKSLLKKIYIEKEKEKAKYDANELFKKTGDWTDKIPSCLIGVPLNLVKITSFASAIKDFCVTTLGLSKNQVYGTDEEKNSLTQIRWQNMPDEIRYRYGGKTLVPYADHSGSEWIPNKSGRMTAREVMQIFGTDVMRNFFDYNIWAKAPFNKYKDSSHKYIIIDDCRFPNEADMSIENDALIIRLERDVLGEDAHMSEKALDDYDKEKYHWTIDNNKYETIEDLHDMLDYILSVENI